MPTIENTLISSIACQSTPITYGAAAGTLLCSKHLHAAYNKYILYQFVLLHPQEHKRLLTLYLFHFLCQII